MDNSHRYFENRACKYYPCHQELADLNCLFCFCPMYAYQHCLGTPVFRTQGEENLKICTNCTFPHQPEHYDDIMEYLKHKIDP